MHEEEPQRPALALAAPPTVRGTLSASLDHPAPRNSGVCLGGEGSFSPGSSKTLKHFYKDCLFSIARVAFRAIPFLPKDPKRTRRQMAPRMTQGMKKSRNPAGGKEAKCSVTGQSPKKTQIKQGLAKGFD